MSLKELGLDRAIDCHTHSAGADYYNLLKGGLPMVQSTEDLLFKSKDSGVGKVVTFPFPNTGYYDIRMLAERGVRRSSGVQEYPYQVENRALVSECKNWKEDTLPFVSIDPTTRVEQQLDFLQRLYEEERFFGFKLHTAAAGAKADSLCNTGFIDFALEKNIPILIHCGLSDEYSHPGNIVNLARDCPGLRICIAHLACLDDESIKAVARTEGLFVDTSPFLQICERVRNGNIGMFSPNDIDPESPAESLYLYYLKLEDSLIWGTDEPWTRGKDGKGNYVGETTLIADVFDLSSVAAFNITTRNTERFLFG